jgi:hypothetical protein
MEGGKKGGLFYDVQNLSRVWNHPYILLTAKERSDQKTMMQDTDEDLEDDEGSLKDFIDDDGCVVSGGGKDSQLYYND